MAENIEKNIRENAKAPAKMSGDAGNVNRTIEREFNRWASAIGLAEKLWAMKLARCGDGEAFAILVDNPRIESPVQLDLMLVEAGGGPFYECLECENDAEEECLPPPNHETCSATENPLGLEVQVHSPGDDWDEIRIEFTLNTSQSNDSCPEMLYDPLTCQPKDETDEYPGT